MKFTCEKSLSEFEPWSGACDTFNKIEEEDKMYILESYLEEMYPEGIDETTLNDLLWFESEWVYELLDIKNDYDEDQDESEDEDETI